MSVDAENIAKLAEIYNDKTVHSLALKLKQQLENNGYPPHVTEQTVAEVQERRDARIQTLAERAREMDQFSLYQLQISQALKELAPSSGGYPEIDIGGELAERFNRLVGCNLPDNLPLEFLGFPLNKGKHPVQQKAYEISQEIHPDIKYMYTGAINAIQRFTWGKIHTLGDVRFFDLDQIKQVRTIGEKRGNFVFKGFRKEI